MIEADWNRNTVPGTPLTCERITDGAADGAASDWEPPSRDRNGNVVLFSRVLYGRPVRRSDPESLVYLPRPPKDGVIPDEPEIEDDDPTLYTLDEMVRAKAVLNERLAAGETVTLFDILCPSPRGEGKFFLWWGRPKNAAAGERMWLFGVPPKAKSCGATR